ncbi:MAG: alpha/beta hydrolase [Melioribacteraceae bacterium]
MKNKDRRTGSFILDSLKIVISISSLLLFSNCSHSIPFEEEAPQNSTYAYSENVRINYETIGHGNKNVVFLHGFGASLHTWDDIKDLFPQDEYKLYLIDLKGFGNSSKPEDDNYTIEEQAKIVRLLINDINADSLYLIGHSYGGAVALLTQISFLDGRDRKRITKLILIDGLAYMQELPVFIDYLRTPVVNKSTFLLPKKFRAEYILDKIFYDKTIINDRLINRYASFFDGDNIDYSFTTSAAQIYPIGYENIIDTYKNIPTSCLVIWGRNDLVIPLENGIRLSRDLPNAKFEIIEECGHAPQEEKPEITFKMIISFIKGE